jgi:hypothetical protein
MRQYRKRHGIVAATMMKNAKPNANDVPYKKHNITNAKHPAGSLYIMPKHKLIPPVQ